MLENHKKFITAIAILVAGPLIASIALAKEDTSIQKRDPMVVIDKNPYPSTYKAFPSITTVIRGATVLTGTGAQLDGASILMENGKIVAVGKDIKIPYGAHVIDGTGKWVTPGIIDVHSHLGVYASPNQESLSDGNEATRPVTADVWAEHSVWPEDPGFSRAIAGGITTLQILPGSANLIGGRGVTLKNVPSRTMEGMKFPGAPYGLKMACGENPKRVYGKKSGPSTRMGNMAGYRKAWIKAQAYKKEWDDYARDYKAGKDVKAPKRDLEMDSLMGVLNGEILVHNHCYRADEMANMIDMAKEFHYKISTFHHAVESYKVADLLAKEHICSAMWADWWGFKLEAFDGVDENIPMVASAGACAIVHSDDPTGIQRLNQEAAKAWSNGRKVGLDFTEGQAFEWLTLNPAKALGIADRTGSLEKGKMADVVVWSKNPFSVYALAEKVFIDGALMYDRDDPNTYWQSDFELGYNRKGAHQ